MVVGKQLISGWLQIQAAMLACASMAITNTAICRGLTSCRRCLGVYAPRQPRGHRPPLAHECDSCIDFHPQLVMTGYHYMLNTTSFSIHTRPAC